MNQPGVNQKLKKSNLCSSRLRWSVEYTEKTFHGALKSTTWRRKDEQSNLLKYSKVFSNTKNYDHAFHVCEEHYLKSSGVPDAKVSEKCYGKQKGQSLTFSGMCLRNDIRASVGRFWTTSQNVMDHITEQVAVVVRGKRGCVFSLLHHLQGLPRYKSGPQE